MAGMIIPSVIIEDGPVPVWVPDAIRAVRRRPATAADAWPADVPAAVLALRLVGSGLLVIHPQLEETAVGVAIDGDESDSLAILLRDYYGCLRHQLLPPAFAPPRKTLGEVDLRIGSAPRAMPQLNRGRFVLGVIRAEVKCHGVTQML